jgi:TRAP-type C4-dicarboxylate transport system substrate-binding protein
MLSQLFTSISRKAGTLLGLFLLGIAGAEAADVIKIATIAPKGSMYHRVLQEIGEAYRDSQGGKARAIVYPDRLQGTEANTVRRMRIGQLDGSMLTSVGLRDIDASVTALQFMPMMFRSWEELDHVREQLRPELEAKLAAKGFIVLMWGEAGWVQFFTRTPIKLPDEFKRTRVWVWDGTPAQVDIMKSLGFKPVPLPLGDILPGLETGMVDTVPTAPIWALVGQFDRITPYMLPINWVPIVGATVFSKRRFDRMAPHVQEAVMSAARAGAEKWPRIRGSMVPADTFDKVLNMLEEFRARTN